MRHKIMKVQNCDKSLMCTYIYTTSAVEPYAAACKDQQRCMKYVSFCFSFYFLLKHERDETGDIILS